jgi:hypothetical protein
LSKPDILSTKRSRKQNYSKPGTYHLCFETHGLEGLLGTLHRDVMTLNAYGEMVLTALALALHRFGGVTVRSMDMRPHKVEVVVELCGWRLKLQQVLDRLNALKILDPARRWLRFRRTQTIPLFVGYVKTNSARRINTGRGLRAPVWKRRYKAAVLTDAQQIRHLCASLDARFARVRIPVHEQSGCGPVQLLLPIISSVIGGMPAVVPSAQRLMQAPEVMTETMLLGRMLLLNRPKTISAREDAYGIQSRLGEVSPSVSARAPAPRILAIEAEVKTPRENSVT